MTSERDRRRWLRKLFKELPAGHCSFYRFPRPATELSLYRGRMELRQNGAVVSLHGSLSFRWRPSIGVHFEGRTGAQGSRLACAGAVLRIPRFLTPVDVDIKELRLGRAFGVSGRVKGSALLGLDRPVRSILCHVPNFHSYVGGRARFGTLDSPRFVASRLVLRDPTWSLELDQQPEFRLVSDALRTSGGFAIGHVGLIQRVDGAAFHYDQAGEFLASTYFRKLE